MHYLKHLAGLHAPDIHPAGASASRRLIDSLKIDHGQQILELGCGTGNTMRRLMHHSKVHVVGIDLLDEMLLGSRSRLQKISGKYSLIRACTTALPFRDEIFDRVYAESVLGIQTVSDIRRILSEVMRVLRPGGLFVANEAIWRPGVTQSEVSAINQLSEVDFGLRPASQPALSVDDWLAEIANAGFIADSASRLHPQAWQTSSRAKVARLARCFRLISSPKSWRHDLTYRKRLATHRKHGPKIEARLFVARKPA